MENSPHLKLLKQYAANNNEIIKQFEVYPAAAQIVTESGRTIKAYSSYKTIYKESYIYLMEILPNGKKKRLNYRRPRQ